MSKHRIYIETCPIIDVMKGRIGLALTADREDDLWHTEQCLRAALQGEVEVVTSMLTVAECRRANQEALPNEEMKRIIRSVLGSGQVFRLAEVTQTIAERARDLEWEDGINLRGADAIHVATAIETNCEEFLTTDGRGPLKNAQKIVRLGLRIIRPSDTGVLPPDYRERR